MDTKISEKVKSLILKYGTRNPFELAKNLGVEVIFKPYLSSFNGYYISVLGNKFIVINSNLDESTQRIVMAHELGHAVLHEGTEVAFIRNNTLLCTSNYEREANEFAAELLIDSSDVDPVILDSMTIEQISNALNVSEEMVTYKINME